MIQSFVFPVPRAPRRKKLYDFGVLIILVNMIQNYRRILNRSQPPRVGRCIEAENKL